MHSRTQLHLHKCTMIYEDLLTIYRKALIHYLLAMQQKTYQIGPKCTHIYVYINTSEYMHIRLLSWPQV